MSDIETLEELLISCDISGMPLLDDFESIFPWICDQLGCEASIFIIKVQQNPYGSGKRHKFAPKSKLKHQLLPDSIQSTHHVSLQHTNSDSFINKKNCIKITTFYDNIGNLVQIKFNKNRKIPELVFKAIGLIMPYYLSLTNLTVNGGINKTSISNINNFFGSNLTEICFDDSYIIDANYDLLLENESHLANLSLSRCKIDDKIAKKIADKLSYPLPASKTLSLLNLASNRISDEGAKYIADALKSNRHLVYLNLADNWIRDEGAGAILDVLVEFQLSFDELKLARYRFLEYCTEKLKNIPEVSVDQAIDEKKDKKKIRKKTKWTISAPKITEDKTFNDPFSPSNTFTKDGVVHCYGNNYLAYINLSYNDISYFTVKKLLNVLIQQRFLNREPRGLINVAIEGNCVPANCMQLRQIDEILLHYVDELMLPKKIFSKKFKSRLSFTAGH